MISRRRFVGASAALCAAGLLPMRAWAQSPIAASSVTPAITPKPKRIVICADGTWNEAEKPDPELGRPLPSNVLKVARAVRPKSKDGMIDQVVYYHYGVGTAGGLDTWTGGAFGEGIEENIRALYRFIVYNWEPGDELYLFGFSRGAFTVRTLAVFMHDVGLLQKKDEYYTRQLYSLYENGLRKDTPEWQSAIEEMKLNLKSSDIRDSPPILFIGVWDTVGALGAPGFIGRLNKGKYKYHDIGLNSSIKNAYQALAIDERRSTFAPNLWTRAGWTGTLSQAWFAGVHSDIGGGYFPDTLAEEALQWMVENAERHGLEFDPEYLDHYLPCFNGNLHDSMTVMYRLLGTLERPIGQHLQDGEAIHKSALDRMAREPCAYAPPNLIAFLKSHPTPPIVTTSRKVNGEVWDGRACTRDLKERDKVGVYCYEPGPSVKTE